MKVFHIAQGQPIPEWFLDAFQEFVSTLASGNFQITKVNSTTLQIVAGTNSDQVTIGISKGGVNAWRYNTATVTAVSPGLAAGTHDIYVTAYGNGPYTNQVGPPSVLDGTNYAFGLKLVQTGTTPSGTVGTSEELYRKIGTFVWDGAAIVGWQQTVGPYAVGLHEALHLPGGSDALPWATIHGAGTIGSRPAAASTNAGFLYLATDVNGGTLYRSDGSTWAKAATGATETPSNSSIAQAILLSGTVGARPAAAGGNTGFFYWASDVNGGTIYQSDGSTWLKRTLGLTELGTAKYTAVIGDGSSTSFTLTHNLGSTDVFTRVREAASPFAVVEPEVRITDANNVTIVFSVAPGVGAYQVVVLGGVAVATPAHAGTHAPGSSDPIDYTQVNLRGTLGVRPAAAAANSGLKYFATDVNSGTEYRSTGSVWEQVSASVLRDAAGSGHFIGEAIQWHGIDLPAFGSETWGWMDGSAISRTTFATLLAALTKAQNGTRTSGSAIITGLGSTTGFATGHKVEGTGIPAGATILTVDSASQITLSANASSSGTNTVTVFPWGNGDGSTTFNVPDERGRMTVGLARSGGHADVSGMGLTEGSSAANRRPKHRTTNSLGLNDPGHVHATHAGDVTGTTRIAEQGGASVGTVNTDSATTGVTITGSIGTNNANDALDTPAYLVRPNPIRMA